MGTTTPEDAMTPLPRPVWPGGPVPPSGAVDAGTIRYEPEERRQPRRITQLCGSAEGIHALCNDGSVWQLIGGVWAPEPAIPQPEDRL